MFKWIKQLFCIHDYWDLSPPAFTAFGKYKLGKCSKCGYVKLRKYEEYK